MKSALVIRIALSLTVAVAGLRSAAQDAVPGLGTYTYDGAGNITGIGSDRFVYDEFGRIRKATLVQGSTTHAQEFTYDRYGNIRRLVTSGESNPAVPAVNEATNRINLSGPTTTMVGAYDAAGNLTGYNGVDRFQYDALNVMTESTVGTERRLYLYTASNERIAVLKMAGTTVASSDWTLRDASAKVLRRFARDAGNTWRWDEDYIYRGSQLLAAEVPGNTLHLHLDHLGTPRVITGNGGARIATHTYYPFGRELTSPAQDSETRKFTGHERDAVNLDYMHARSYLPWTGRFLTVDPVIDFKTNMTNPQGWNRYSYVRNNPVRWTDPTGKVIAYDDEFRKRVKNDAQFREAFQAWKQTKSGAAQWKAMAGDRNTVYKVGVGKVVEMTGPLRAEEVSGVTRPVIGPRNENKSGKLDMRNVSITINVDYIKSTHSMVPEMIPREIAKTIFHEATHGLDIGSGSRSARQALSVDPQYRTGTEPRLNLFERELNSILPPPDWD